jgi:hypothetical protein
MYAVRNDDGNAVLASDSCSARIKWLTIASRCTSSGINGFGWNNGATESASATTTLAPPKAGFSADPPCPGLTVTAPPHLYAAHHSIRLIFQNVFTVMDHHRATKQLRINPAVSYQADTVMPRRSAKPALGGAKESALGGETQQIGCIRDRQIGLTKVLLG